MTEHQTQWQQLQIAWSLNRLPQALLLVGPVYAYLSDFVKAFVGLLLCSAKKEQACGVCNDCLMHQQAEHPDLQWVAPEKTGGAIKIEQIRELQSSAFLTAQRASCRVIVIESADRMNTASANALLKLLEEPPAHTQFILLTEQISTVLPTILSRCQRLRFAGAKSNLDSVLELANYYPENSTQAEIAKSTDEILDGLIALLQKQEAVCTLAAKWAKFELQHFLGFMYLIMAQLQHMHFMNAPVNGSQAVRLQQLVTLVQPLTLWKQIDKLNAVLNKLSKNIPVNATLAVEDCLLTLIEA